MIGAFAAGAVIGLALTARHYGARRSAGASSSPASTALPAASLPPVTARPAVTPPGRRAGRSLPKKATPEAPAVAARPVEPPPVPPPAAPAAPPTPPPAPPAPPTISPAELSKLLVQAAPPEVAAEEEAASPGGSGGLEPPEIPASPSFAQALKFLPRHALYFSFTTVRDGFGVLCRTEACGRKITGFENDAVAEGQRILNREFDQNAPTQKRYGVLLKARSAVERSLTGDLRQYKQDCAQAGVCQ